MGKRVERLFGYLKEMTAVFHNKLSARDHIKGTTNLNLFTLYYQAMKGGGG
ncbi:MAG: hypothetical protein QXQ48_09110 [Nitrososphaerota archaeon]